MSAGLIAEIERLLTAPTDADDILRGTVSALAAEPGIAWAGIGFAEEGEIALGPFAGTPDPEHRARVPIAFEGAVVGELWVDGEIEAASLDQLAERIAPYVLIGWDTGGEAWEP